MVLVDIIFQVKVIMDWAGSEPTTSILPLSHQYLTHFVASVEMTVDEMTFYEMALDEIIVKWKDIWWNDIWWNDIWW
jgi:hypothetical protein